VKEIALHILDITQNSIEAGADKISISVRDVGNTFSFTVDDNGKGMDKAIIEKITDPCYTTRQTRKVGMGLAFLKQNTAATGGKVEIESEINKGTIVKASFISNHIDRPPVGDLAGVLLQLLTGNGEIDFFIYCQTDNGVFELNSIELKEVLDDVPLNSLKIRKYLKGLIEENIKGLRIRN
jgi:anti-sigma regulatory factor (Ser/Thr protein kinase)